MKEIKLSAVGDILLNSSHFDSLDGKFTDLLNGISSEFKDQDIVFGNLETPLTSKGKPIPNKCCLRSNPESISALEEAGFNILSIANNHMFDFGVEGFIETIEILDAKNIKRFGAGLNLAEARKPTIIKTADCTFGFLGYSWDIIQSVSATRNKFGTAPLNKRMILNDIQKLKSQVDIIIIVLHWGYVGENYPLPSHRKLAHAIIDAGADLILGSHTHVLQGIEKYNQGVIVYSFGNFIFPDIFYEEYKLIQNDENKESFIFHCIFTKEGIKDYSVTPVTVTDTFQPISPDIERQNEILEKIAYLSRGFNNKNYTTFWKENRKNKNLPDLKFGPFLNKIIFKFSSTKLNRRIRRILNRMFRKR